MSKQRDGNPVWMLAGSDVAKGVKERLRDEYRRFNSAVRQDIEIAEKMLQRLSRSWYIHVGG